MWYPILIVVIAIVLSRLRKAGMFKSLDPDAHKIPTRGPAPATPTPKIFLPGERDSSGRLRSDAEQIAASGKPYPGT